MCCLRVVEKEKSVVRQPGYVFEYLGSRQTFLVPKWLLRPLVSFHVVTIYTGFFCSYRIF